MIAIGGEELASVCAPMAFTLGFNHGALQPVLRAGTSEQKQVFVRDLLAGRNYASLCMTEPDTSGSNLLSMQTKARNSGSGWVINGRKCMTGVGTEASVFFVFAETETNGTQRGISVFAVPRGPGVEVGENTDKIGFRCVPTPSITFTDVHVPDEHLIGTIGTGDLILLQCLDYMRFGGISGHSRTHGWRAARHYSGAGTATGIAGGKTEPEKQHSNDPWQLLQRSPVRAPVAVAGRETDR